MKVRIRTKASLENEYGLSRDRRSILVPNFAIDRRFEGFFGECLEIKKDPYGDCYAEIPWYGRLWIWNLNAVVEEVIDCQDEV